MYSLAEDTALGSVSGTMSCLARLEGTPRLWSYLEITPLRRPLPGLSSWLWPQLSPGLLDPASSAATTFGFDHCQETLV